jgi:hypothetical protein
LAALRRAHERQPDTPSARLTHPEVTPRTRRPNLNTAPPRASPDGEFR